ncbi:MAG: transposase [Pseudomonadota bacterium]
MRAHESQFHPGRTWFFTLNLADKNSTLLTKHANLLAESSRDFEALYPVESIAVVILPDHMHLIWTLPEDDLDYDRRITYLQTGFTKRVLALDDLPAKHRDTARWMPRYWDYQIRDLLDLEKHIGFMHGNPVKHGLVSHPDKWRYSTWHKFRDDGFLLWTHKPLGTTGEP